MKIPPLSFRKCDIIRDMNESGTIYESSEKAARRWGISARRVRVLCENGLVVGALRDGKLWRIPQTAEKPLDGRTKRHLGIPAAMRGEIVEIDRLNDRLAAMRPLTDGERERLRQAFLVDFTYSSNAIEGNTLTLSETALVLSGMTVGEKPLKDHLEATGHRDAFCFLEEFVKSDAPVSEAFIRQLHSLVLADKPLDRGVYRRIPVIITGAVHTPPQPYMVAPMMEAWVRELQTTCLHPLVAAAEFHVRFEAIHPFIDGNGRTGRLLANFILMRGGYLPISIKYENRRAYYEAFTAYHAKGDISPMLAIFAERERQRLADCLSVF